MKSRLRYFGVAFLVLAILGFGLAGGVMLDRYVECGVCPRVQRPIPALTRIPPESEVVLHDHEHDRFEWVSLSEALSRCRPELVAHGIERAAHAIGLI